MQAKNANKSPRKKSVKKASRVSKPKKKSPPKKNTSPSKPKSKLKKSVARKALRSALAKRATRKVASKAKPKPKKKASATKAKPKRKIAAKVSKKTSVRKSAKKKSPPKKCARKTAAKKKAPAKKKPALKKKAAPNAKKTLSKKSPKAKKLSPKGAGADATQAPAKPEKKVPPLDRGEISKLLSDRYTRHLVIDSGGEYALEIIRGFSNNSSDEDMAKKLKIKISDVRATLNKLHSLGIVEYTRHKDSETGWFSYYWYLNVARIKDWVSKKMDEEHRRLDFSNGEHYYCPGCGGASIHDFVSASDFGFKCPTCGSSLDFLSDEKVSEFFPMRSFRKPFL